MLKYILIFILLITPVFACQISIKTEKDIYNISEKINYKHNVDIKNYTIEYWITNQKGTLIQAHKNTTNINSKVYTPSSINNITLHAILYPCGNTTKKLITIQGKSIKKPTANNINAKKNPKEIYQSSSEKSKVYAKYGLIASLVLIIFSRKNDINRKNNHRTDGLSRRPCQQSYGEYPREIKKNWRDRNSKKRFGTSREN